MSAARNPRTGLSQQATAALEDAACTVQQMAGVAGLLVETLSAAKAHVGSAPINAVHAIHTLLDLVGKQIDTALEG